MLLEPREMLGENAVALPLALAYMSAISRPADNTPHITVETSLSQTKTPATPRAPLIAEKSPGESPRAAPSGQPAQIAANADRFFAGLADGFGTSPASGLNVIGIDNSWTAIVNSLEFDRSRTFGLAPAMAPVDAGPSTSGAGSPVEANPRRQVSPPPVLATPAPAAEAAGSIGAALGQRPGATVPGGIPPVAPPGHRAGVSAAQNAPKPPRHGKQPGPEVANGPNLTWSLKSNYIPLDGDTDDGSSVTNERAATPDNQSTGDFPDLAFVEADVTAYPVGTGGYFTWSWSYNFNGHSTNGSIRLWSYQGTGLRLMSGQRYSEGQWPMTFYVQGVTPSAWDGEIALKLSYTYGSTTTSQTANVTVTPVVTSFQITAGSVSFINNKNGLLGLQTGGVTNPATGQETGALFSATAETTGLKGQMVFVQNLTTVINGVDSQGHGAVYADNTFQNDIVNPNLDPQTNHQFPFLDRSTPAPPAYYDVNFTSSTVNGVQTMSADDNPALGPPNRSLLTGVGVEEDFYLWLMWDFTNANGTSNLYPLALASWDVNFGANNYQPGQGVTSIMAGSGVFGGSWSIVDYSSFPVTTNTITNQAIIWAAAS